MPDAVQTHTPCCGNEVLVIRDVHPLWSWHCECGRKYRINREGNGRVHWFAIDVHGHCHEVSA